MRRGHNPAGLDNEMIDGWVGFTHIGLRAPSWRGYGLQFRLALAPFLGRAYRGRAGAEPRSSGYDLLHLSSHHLVDQVFSFCARVQIYREDSTCQAWMAIRM